MRRPADRAWGLLLARSILGLTFFMAGWWKVFQLGPLEHARVFFVEPYAGTFLPAWLLWAGGTAVPPVELGAGALLLAGWRRRTAYLALGAVLVMVTFGHLVAEPLFALHEHVIPRALLLIFLLVMPAEDDRFSLDVWLEGRRGGR